MSRPCPFFRSIHAKILQEIQRGTTIKSIGGIDFYLRDVLALMLNMIKKEFEDFLATSATKLPAAAFHWVITVPNIWNAAGKQIMREAAYEVNYNIKSSLHLCIKKDGSTFKVVIGPVKISSWTYAIAAALR